MAKDSTSSKIWRTVVFAGAMLGTPALVAAQGAPTTPPVPSQPKAGAPVAAKPAPKPDPALERQGKIKALDGERNLLLGKLVETDPKDIDKLRKEIVTKDAAIKKLVDEIVAMRKPRPRALPDSRPKGRGFVLA